VRNKGNKDDEYRIELQKIIKNSQTFSPSHL